MLALSRFHNGSQFDIFEDLSNPFKSFGRNGVKYRFIAIQNGHRPALILPDNGHRIFLQLGNSSTNFREYVMCCNHYNTPFNCLPFGPLFLALRFLELSFSALGLSDSLLLIVFSAC